MAGGLPAMPVVKADAYGHGMVPVARALEAAGVDGALRRDARRGGRPPRGRHHGARPRPLSDPGRTRRARGAARRRRRVRRRRPSRWRRCSRRPSAAGVVADLADRAGDRDRARARRGAPEDVVAVATRSSDAGATLSGVWTPPPGGGGRRRSPTSQVAGSRPRSPRSRRPASRSRDATSPRAPRSCSATCRATTPSAPG